MIASRSCRLKASKTCLSASSRRLSLSIAQLLFVGHPAERGGHAGALVEAERAGLARRVDAEPDDVLAALPEAPEGVGEEPRAHALLAPGATREELAHKA